MKIRSLFLVSLLGAATLRLTAQYQSSYQPQYQPQPSYQPQVVAPNQYAPTADATLDPTQLDQLLSPVALYPDPLIGVMLPASTHPDDVSAAASFVSANADPAQISQQPWDDSVKALAQYRDVVLWMAQNADWTNQLGTAVEDQQQDVLNSIQRLRANALHAGMLATNAQQQVVVSNDVISIIPAQQNTVYVPTYDPQYLYTPSYSGPPPVIRYGSGYPIGLGIGLVFGVDWAAHSVWFDHESREHHDWRRLATAPTHHVWRPVESDRRAHFEVAPQRAPAQIAHPAPYSEHFSRWSQPTRTPGLVPTGRTYPYMAPHSSYVAPHSAPVQPRTYTVTPPTPGRRPEARPEHPHEDEHDRDHAHKVDRDHPHDDDDDRRPQER